MSTDLDERYTLPATIEILLGLAGIKRFDLDVAACAESHWANRWYSADSDGLAQSWLEKDRASWVFCNCPWSSIPPWVCVARVEIASAPSGSGIVLLLPANRCEQPWWQDFVEPYRDGRGAPRILETHFLAGRTRYGSPGDPLGGLAGSPPFGSVALIWRVL